MTSQVTKMEWKEEIKHEIISIIAKLDNGSHSSSQLQACDEALTDLFLSKLTLSESRVRGEEREKFIKILDQEVYEWNESYGDEAIEYTQTKMAVEYIKQALANANNLSTPLKEK